VLGVGALGLAWALTTTAAYLPPILGRYTDSETLVGLVLAAAFVVLVFLVSVAGGAVTLAWGLLFQLMPDDERGTVAGLATTTKGLCLVIRPLAAGAAIDILGPTLESTEGYQVLWPVLSIPILLAIPLVSRLARDERRS